jgi:hypothetical protein
LVCCLPLLIPSLVSYCGRLLVSTWASISSVVDSYLLVGVMIDVEKKFPLWCCARRDSTRMYVENYFLSKIHFIVTLLIGVGRGWYFEGELLCVYYGRSNYSENYPIWTNSCE